MPPSSHCSAGHFIVGLRIIGSTKQLAIAGRAASLGDQYHQVTSIISGDNVALLTG